MKKKIILSLLFLLLTALICTAGGQQEAPETVTATSDGRIMTLEVGTTNRLEEIYYFHMGSIWPDIFTHETLVWQDASGDFKPVLAESWEVSGDMKTWTFHMVKDALWHDGTPVTAKDFEFTIKYYQQHSKYQSAYRHLISVEAADNYTIVTKIDDGDYSWLGNIGKKKILPKHIWEGIEDPYRFTDTAKTSIGCGPYVFIGYDKSAGIGTWKAFEDYRLGIPNVGTIKVHEFGNEDTMIMALDKEEIDVSYIYAGGISYFNVPKLMKNDEIKIDTIPSNGISNNLWFNTKIAPFNSQQFRNAISYLIDYNELKNLFTAGYGDTIYRGWIPEEGFKYYKETEELVLDIEKAGVLLDELGFIDIDKDGFRESPDGTKFSAKLTVRSDQAEDIRVGERIVKYFNQAGLNLEIKLIDRSIFFDVVEGSEDFEMVLARTTFSGMTAYAGYGTGYVDDRDFGWSTYENKEFQSITDRFHTTFDEVEREKLVHQLMDHYSEYVPVIKLYNMGLLQPYNRKYSGYSVMPIFGIMSPETWFNLAPASN